MQRKSYQTQRLVKLDRGGSGVTQKGWGHREMRDYMLGRFSNL